MWHCWDLLAPPQSFGAPRSDSTSPYWFGARRIVPPFPLVTPLGTVPLVWVLVEICIACLYSNQNIETATMLRFSNIATSAAVEESDHQFWAGLQKNLAWVLSPPGPGYDVPLVPLSRRPCAQEPGSLFWCHAYAVVSLQFTHGRSFASKGSYLPNLQVDCFTVGLYCVTITWQRIFWCSLQVTISALTFRDFVPRLELLSLFRDF